MKEKTIICAAFCGTGKSYLCNNSPETYKEIECWEYRGKKFPNNYIQDVIKYINQTKYLFISTDPVILRGLNDLGIEIRLIYPETELRNEYLDRYISRNDPYDFIGTIMKNWRLWISELNELKEHKGYKHTVLKSGQYLQDLPEFHNNSSR